jgi:ferritin-like metal-binding protein YciE
MNKRDELVSWLNDAYAMERALQITLEKQVNSSEVHRAVRERAGIHLDETRAHAERVQQCLEMLGHTPSPIKTTAAQVMESGKKFMTMFARDERVKDYLAATGAEHFEVACYRALIAAAQFAGEEGIVPLLEQNLSEDTATARWLENNIAAVVRDYLSESAGHSQHGQAYVRQ